MEEIKKVLTIQTSEGERSVKSLRKEISDMRDALLNVEKGSQDWEDISRKLIKAQEDLTSVTKVNKQTVEAATDSIVGMERQYKSLYDAYKLLSEEQRKSQFGKEMAKQLETLSNKLNDTKKEVGNYKDNIGRYTQGVMDAFAKMGASAKALQNPMKAASMGVKAVGSSMKTLAANPVGATLLALVTIFSKLSTAIKGNEELQRSMNKVMAAFKPIGDAVAIVFDKIAGLAVKVAEGTAKVVTWFTRRTKAGRDLADAEAEVAEMQDELIDKKREYETLNAADEAEIAALREKAAETENETEKQKYLNEAMEIQNRVNDRNVDLRQQEYEMIKKRNAISPSPTEAIEEEADALKALNEAREDSSRKNTELQKQLNNVTKTKKKDAEEWKKAIQEIQDAGKTASEQEIARYNEEVEELKKTLKEKEGSLKDFNNAVKTLQYRHQTNMIQIQREVSDRTREMEYNLIPFPSKQYYEKKIDELSDFYAEAKSFVYSTDYFTKNFGNGESFDEDTKARIYAAFGFNVDNLAQLKMQVELVKKEITQTLGEWSGYEIGIASKRDSIRQSRDLATLLSITYNTYAVAFKELEESGELYNPFGNPDMAAAKVKRTLDIERKGLEDRYNLYDEYRKIIERIDNEELNETNAKTNGEKMILAMSLDERLDLMKEYYAAAAELRDFDIDHQSAAIDRYLDLNEVLQESYIDLFDTVADHLTTVTNLWQNSIQTQLQDGKITEKEAKRKKNIFKTLEAISLTVNLAQIAGSTASGIMDVWKSYAGELVANAETAAATGPAAAATKAALDAKSLAAANIRTATLATAGATSAAAAIAGSIANFKSINGMDGGSTGASGIPAMNDTNPFAYTRNVTTASEEERLNQPIKAFVVESEVSAKQELSSKRNQESTF